MVRKSTSSEKGNAKAHAEEAYRNFEHLKASALHTFEEGKEKSKELFEEGKKKLSNAENQIENYVNELSKKVQKNPISSILIAGGIGYILSTLLRK